MTVESGRWGSKIGPRIAMLVSQAMVYTHSRLATLKHKIAMSVFHAISDEISEEVDTTVGPFIAMMHDAIDKQHPAYPLIHFMHTQKGQLKALTGSAVSASGLLGALSAIMNNELAVIQYDVIRSNPHLIPSIGDAANMAATGIIGDAEVNGLANANGFDNGWAANYLELARTYPTADVGLDLLRRGLISEEDMVTILARSGMPNKYWGLIIQTRNGPVSVADAALGVLRGSISFDEGARIAAENGYNLDSFNILIANTGEPPGLEQLLEAYRRGFIDQATLEKGILQSRYRNEWIPTLEKLRYSPMSVADAVNAVVQSHIPMDQGASIAQQNGLEPGAFEILYQTAGEPLSRTEMEQLYNRGLVTKAEVEQALRESRLKNKYVEPAFELHQKIIPVATIQRALRYGAISHADAVRIVMEDGYSEQDATTIVTAGSSERLQTYKDRVTTSVQSLYEDNIIDPVKAAQILTAMGHTDTEASFILESAEFHRNAKLTSQVVQAIKAKYIQRRITKQQVLDDLSAMAIPAQQISQLIKAWDTERGAYTKVLTQAQIVKAVRLQLITPDDGVARLVYDGYSEGDAKLLIEGA